MDERIIITKDYLLKRLKELGQDKSFPIPVSREFLMELMRIALDGLNEASSVIEDGLSDLD